jgi:sulfoquinovose isomerase
VTGRRQAWSEQERLRLADFAQASVNRPVGFGWLDDTGRVDRSQPVHTWISTRMTHVFALAALQGADGALEAASHGVRSLLGPLRDEEYGGWFASVASDGSQPVDGAKQAYAHAFVALAASSAVAAAVPGAEDLLDEALTTLRERFLDDTGRVIERYDRQFEHDEPYRGANASMHMVEAMLAVGDVTADATWHRRACAIAEHLVHQVARGHGYLMPEHFAADWTVRHDYNADRPDDPFRPFGCTPGHLLEWSRLLVGLEASLQTSPTWLLEDAVGLFDAAVRVGWEVDGRPGFAYTVDWTGRPVVRTRMHWVVAEAIGAAGALHRRTRDARFASWFETWWDYAETYLVDRARGSWHHELDVDNRPSSTVWSGKPDVYHAYQATLFPWLALAPSAAEQLRRSAAPAPG